MARIFIYDGRELPDPDSHLSVDEVRQSLTNFFPELSNAETKQTKRGDDDVYTFQKRVGTKGCGCIQEIEATIKANYNAARSHMEHKGNCVVCITPTRRDGQPSKHNHYPWVPWNYCPFCGEKQGD